MKLNRTLSLFICKVSATYLDGYRATAVATVGGGRAKEKAELTAKAIIKRQVLIIF